MAFSDIIKDPQPLVGEVVLLGGRLIATTPHDRGTELVVLQLPLEMAYGPSPAVSPRGVSWCRLRISWTRRYTPPTGTLP
jgi:starvation-inducible outer membrane lipoprotein